MSEQDSCSNCTYCYEIYGHGYEGFCKGKELFLRTIDDRLCEKYEEDLR